MLDVLRTLASNTLIGNRLVGLWKSGWLVGNSILTAACRLERMADCIQFLLNMASHSGRSGVKEQDGVYHHRSIMTASKRSVRNRQGTCIWAYLFILASIFNLWLASPTIKSVMIYLDLTKKDKDLGGSITKSKTKYCDNRFARRGPLWVALSSILLDVP